MPPCPKLTAAEKFVLKGVLGFVQVAALIFGVWVCVVSINQRVLHGQNDFVGLYMGGVLVGTPTLYSYSDNRALMNHLVHLDMIGTGFVRPPFYAVAIKPLTLLPYPAAYWLFQLTMAGVLAWFAWRFSRECSRLALVVLFAPPVLMCMVIGQDMPLYLAVAASSILLYRKHRWFMGGLVLALCLVKVHLFVFVFLLLLIKRRWNALAGLFTGGSLLFAAGAIGAGLDSYRGWINMITNPVISPGRMTNIHQLVKTLHGDATLDVILAGGLAALFIWMCFRSDEFEFLFSLALIAGLLINMHSYPYDTVLLLLPFVLIRHTTLRLILLFLLSPVAYFFLLWSTTPFVIILLIVVLAAAACSAANSRSPQYAVFARAV